MVDFNGVDLTTENLHDLWKTTISEYEWQDKGFVALLEKHHWVVCDQWFGSDNMEEDSSGGTQIVREVVYRSGGGVQYVKPGQSRTRTSVNTLAQLKVNWVTAVRNYDITKAQMRRNFGRAKIHSEIDRLRLDAKLSLFKDLEDRAWMTPDDSSDDIHPMGVPFWIVKIQTDQVTAHGTAGTNTGAFQGGNPYGWTDTGGINAGDYSSGWSSSTYAKWRNYNDVWTNTSGLTTEDDLKKMGRMHRNLHFYAPKMVEELALPVFKKIGLYCGQDRIDSISAATRRGMQDIGPNPGRLYGAGLNMSGDPTFKGLPLTWIEYLDADADDPLYMLNHSYFYPVVERGGWMSEDPVGRTPDQPDVLTVWIDNNFNFLCRDRQKGGGVISEAGSTNL